MAFQHYKLEFKGYCRGKNVDKIPNKSGIYCVYTCTFNEQDGNFKIHDLIYIGEAAKVHDRIINHEKISKWLAQLKKGEELCFSFALISPQGARRRAEAALIYQHQPPLNYEYKFNFPFDRTEISTSGRNRKLQKNFVVS